MTPPLLPPPMMLYRANRFSLFGVDEVEEEDQAPFSQPLLQIQSLFDQREYGVSYMIIIIGLGTKSGLGNEDDITNGIIDGLSVLHKYTDV